MRMVFEEELRCACERRDIEPERMRRWLEIRRRLPLNRWIDRDGMRGIGQDELVRLKREINAFLELFHAESARYPFELDMRRNYYRAALNLMGQYPPGARMEEKDRRILTGLMVMVDLKDARLAMQIMNSIA